MRVSPIGAVIVLLGAIAGIAIWTIAYIKLPNTSTHRNLSANPPVATSVPNSPGTGASASTTGTGQP